MHNSSIILLSPQEFTSIGYSRLKYKRDFSYETKSNGMPLKRNYIDLISSRAVYAFHLNYIHQMWYRYYTGVKIESYYDLAEWNDKQFWHFYVIWAYFNICALVGVRKWSNFWLGNWGLTFRIISITFQNYSTALTQY